MSTLSKVKHTRTGKVCTTRMPERMVTNLEVIGGRRITQISRGRRIQNMKIQRAQTLPEMCKGIKHPRLSKDQVLRTLPLRLSSSKEAVERERYL